MKIHLYCLCWNEERFLPFFLRFYESLVDEIFVFDDGSTDRSLEILRAHPRVRVERFERPRMEATPASADFVPFYDGIWRRSIGDADWVILCNIDELFYHPGSRAYLEACLKDRITWIPSAGYDLLSWAAPTSSADLLKTVRRGVRNPLLDKVCAFHPEAIQETRFDQGRHRAHPAGDVRMPPTTEVKLLHYQYLGFRSFVRRHGEKRERMRTNYWRSSAHEAARFFGKSLMARKIL